MKFLLKLPNDIINKGLCISYRKDKINEQQRQRYHDKHDRDIKKKRGRKQKLSITGQDYGNSTSPGTSDQEH